MKLFSLDEMITPKILTGIYILTTLFATLAAVFTLINGSIEGAVAWAIVAIFNRIFFECIIVVFKNNEYLRRIAHALDGGEPDLMADIIKKSGRTKNDSQYKGPQDKQ